MRGATVQDTRAITSELGAMTPMESAEEGIPDRRNRMARPELSSQAGEENQGAAPRSVPNAKLRDVCLILWAPKNPWRPRDTKGHSRPLWPRLQYLAQYLAHSRELVCICYRKQ